jgi:hypothetical protein
MSRVYTYTVPAVMAALRELDAGGRRHHSSSAVAAHLGWAAHHNARLALVEARKRKLATFCARRCGWRRALGA